MSKLKCYDISMALNSVETKAFEDYCKKTDCSHAGAIVCLIREHLMTEKIEDRKEIIIHLDRDERISRCEGKIKAVSDCIRSLTTKNEKLEEQLACLQSEVVSLQDLFLLLKKSCK